MDEYVYQINENTAIEFLNTQKFQDAEKYCEARKITHFDLTAPLLGKEVVEIIPKGGNHISVSEFY